MYRAYCRFSTILLIAPVSASTCYLLSASSPRTNRILRTCAFVLTWSLLLALSVDSSCFRSHYPSAHELWDVSRTYAPVVVDHACLVEPSTNLNIASINVFVVLNEKVELLAFWKDSHFGTNMRYCNSVPFHVLGANELSSHLYAFHRFRYSISSTTCHAQFFLLWVWYCY